MRFAVIALALLAGQGQAQASDSDTLAAEFGHLTLECLAHSDDSMAAKSCLNMTAAACMEQSEGGYSTLGMVFCTAAETKIWDDALNAEWPMTKAWAKAMDADDQEHFPEYARRAETLLAAQRAWIAFRDAQCDLEYAQWGAGSMRQTAGAACMLDMTAKRVLALRAFREEY